MVSLLESFQERINHSINSIEINGNRLVKEDIHPKLTEVIALLKKDDVIPTLAVIEVGNDLASRSYGRRQQQTAYALSCRLIHQELDGTHPEELSSTIDYDNRRNDVHGIIVQGGHDATINPKKDVDGSLPDSPFNAPVAKAVITILKKIHEKIRENGFTTKDFDQWCKSNNFVVVGQGKAGTPIIRTLQEKGYIPDPSVNANDLPHVIDKDMKRNRRNTILRKANVVISCVGAAQKNVIKKNDMRPNIILISVGMWHDDNGGAHGDYETADAKRQHVLAYTPTPGGVGPVTTIELWTNVVWAAIQKAKNDTCLHAIDAEQLFMRSFPEFKI